MSKKTQPNQEQPIEPDDESLMREWFESWDGSSEKTEDTQPPPKPHHKKKTHSALAAAVSKASQKKRTKHTNEEKEPLQKKPKPSTPATNPQDDDLMRQWFESWDGTSEKTEDTLPPPKPRTKKDRNALANAVTKASQKQTTKHKDGGKKPLQKKPKPSTPATNPQDDDLMRQWFESWDGTSEKAEEAQHLRTAQAKKHQKAPNVCIDLHGLTSEAARKRIDNQIQKWASQYGEVSIKVITGRGIHSSGQPILATDIYNHVQRCYSGSIVSIDTAPMETQLGGLPLRGWFHVHLKFR